MVWLCSFVCLSFIYLSNYLSVSVLLLFFFLFLYPTQRFGNSYELQVMPINLLTKVIDRQQDRQDSK